MREPVEIAVYSDYLCPWCYIATIRLRRIKEEYGDSVAILWRSYPLRHGTTRAGTFQHSNQGRLRAAAEEKSLVFNLWPEDRAMPASSFPALEAAKCAQLQGAEPFERLHLLLMQAYFADCLDISQRDVLVALAEKAGLDLERFCLALDDGSHREKILTEYRECQEKYPGWGVPTAVCGGDIVLAGAVPVEIYRRAISAASRVA